MHYEEVHYEEAFRHCIFRYTSGSHQYGTNRPDSDIDKRGVFIAPLRCAFDLFKTRIVGSGTIKQALNSALDAIEIADLPAATNHIEAALQTDRGDLSLSVETVHATEGDEELQELRKYVKLAADCNPNIIEFMYVDHLIDICAPEWERVRENRHLFLSKKARWTFAGYAIQQLKRIRIHRGYLLNPPDHKPTRKEFGLPEQSKIPKDNQNAILSLPDEWLADFSKDQVYREKQYASAMQVWDSYHKWERERNPARKELERKYGYDVKHALHLIRLVRMAREILRDGVVLVRRPDAEELRGILRGEWKYEDVESAACNLDSELDTLYRNSPLPESPDRKAISQLYREICENRYKIKF
jgi:predicted nucleotidyltransferase